ncbi:MAG: hypothetical protein AAGK01_08495, partial [Pseudomonadota bacterium]
PNSDPLPVAQSKNSKIMVNKWLMAMLNLADAPDGRSPRTMILKNQALNRKACAKRLVPLQPRAYRPRNASTCWGASGH